MGTGENLSTLLSLILYPLSWRQQTPPKQGDITTELHGIIFQMTAGIQDILNAKRSAVLSERSLEIIATFNPPVAKELESTQTFKPLAFKQFVNQIFNPPVAQ
jgi:hypothetical protein